MCTKEELEQASERGARKVLNEIFGGDYEAAKEDIQDLRSMLAAMRLYKASFVNTSVKIFTYMFWAIVIGSLTMYIKSKIGH